MEIYSGDNGGEEQDHRHDDKKSVLKKVKDKAIKIKNTITKHGHEQEHDHISNEDEEEDENNPEIHCAPKYESNVIRSTNLPMQTDAILGKPSGLKNSSTSMEGDRGHGNEKEDLLPRKVEVPVAYSGGCSPSNYEAKVVDPTGEGGNEAEVTSPLIQSFGNLKVEDQHEEQKQPLESTVYIGTHGELTRDAKTEPERTDLENPESVPRDAAAGNKPVLETAADYGSRVVEKLTPIYEKVAEIAGGGGAAVEVESVKEYLVEKFRPGDEDKALSEKITEALRKKDELPIGTVKESPAVVERFGKGQEGKREGQDAIEAGRESSGEGIVDRLKDAASLWLGKSTGMQTAQESLQKSYLSGAPETGGDQDPRKLQESSW